MRICQKETTALKLNDLRRLSIAFAIWTRRSNRLRMLLLQIFFFFSFFNKIKNKKKVGPKLCKKVVHLSCFSFLLKKKKKNPIVSLV
jgi:hypothetical protein